MAYIQYLNFDGVDLPYPMSYDIHISDVEADSSGETEAGTSQRDIIRSGVITISVSFLLSASWLKRMSQFRKQSALLVKYFDTEKLDIKETKMYMDQFQSSLVKDTSYKGLWKVSFELKEY